MTEPDQELGGEAPAEQVVAIQMVEIHRALPAPVGDEGDPALAQERDPLVVPASARDHQTVDPPAPHQALIDRELALPRLRRGDHQLQRLGPEDLAQADHHLEVERVGKAPRRQWENHAHSLDAPGDQPLGGDVRRIAEAARGRDDALAGCRRHIVVAIQRARDRRDRQPELSG